MSKKRANPASTVTGKPATEVVSSSLEKWLIENQGQRVTKVTSNRPYGLGGAYRDRTDDPLLAKQVLSQLS